MKNVMRIASASLALALVGAGLSGCAGGGGGGSTSDAAKEFGPITVVQGKDNNGVLPVLKALWDKTHPNEKVTFKQQSDQADAQLTDLLLHFQKKSPDYDVVSADVVWTQELAANGYLQPLTGPFKIDTGTLVPAVLNTATYRKILFAAPASTDSQILYYRKDLLGSKPVPTTYAQLLADCTIAKAHGIGCYAGQYAKYEGLTVNFSEAVDSAGGTVVDAEARAALAAVVARLAAHGLIER